MPPFSQAVYRFDKAGRVGRWEKWWSSKGMNFVAPELEKGCVLVMDLCEVHDDWGRRKMKWHQLRPTSSSTALPAEVRPMTVDHCLVVFDITYRGWAQGREEEREWRCVGSSANCRVGDEWKLWEALTGGPQRFRKKNDWLDCQGIANVRHIEV